MDEELRPDRTGIIFEKVEGGVYLGTRHCQFLDGYKLPAVQKMIRSLVNSGFPVVITSFTDHPKIIFKTKTRNDEEIWQTLRKARERKNDSSILYH
jgi:hypothetical protein